MPELPEVETVRLGLISLIPDKTVKAVTSDNPKSFPNAPADIKSFLIGVKVATVRRRAKVLIIDLDSGYSLVTHLKMTGQLVFRANDDFGDSRLFFNDQRKFGWMRLVPTLEITSIDFFRKVGPEPLADDFTAKDFIKRLQRRPRSNIKAVLLDQTVIAGVGNIYADESLFAAGIHPLSLAGQIPKKKLETLFHELQAVLRLAIEKGGSTDRNYVDAKGRQGSYLDFAKVFRRDGQACLVCGTIIEKSRVAGRGTHTCPTCQPRQQRKNK